MPFPRTGVLDDFNRADENPLADGNWSGPITTGNPELQLLSNQLASTTAAANNSYWSATTFGPDSEVHALIGTKSSDTLFFLLLVRLKDVGTAGPDGYGAIFVEHAAATDDMEYLRIDDNVSTQLGATVNLEMAAGDSVGLESIDDTHVIYHKPSAGSWSAIDGGRVDATYPDAGFLGVSANNTTYRLDDFGGGTVPAVLPEDHWSPAWRTPRRVVSVW